MSSSAGQRELLKLTRLAPNRLCADCKVPLGDHRIFASLSFGVLICEACSEQHIVVLGKSASIKVAVFEECASWSKEDVKKMQESISNVAVNNTLERYVPQDWKKLVPTSSNEERKKWITAKYDVLYFTFPDGLNYTAMQQQQQRLGPKSKKTGKNNSSKDDTSLPVRIADFFVTVGAGECKQYGQNFQTRSFVKGGSSDSPANPEDITFKPSVVNCCPPESDYSDMELPEFLAPCVFPCDLKLSAVDCPPHSFTFVLTNASGMKLYGAALHVYELVEPEDLAQMLGHPVGSSMLPTWPIVYMPKALTVVSHYPFYSCFSGFLRNIYHISLSSAPMPLERYAINFLKEVPLPPSGRVDVRYFMPNNVKMTISRPPPNKLPMADFSYRPLFSCLSVENIIIIFQCLCAELTVCICSDNLSLLTPVQEAFLSFLFPLVWQGCYIPVMPLNMVEILDAPVPFLIGVHSQYLRTTPKERRPQSVVFVDLQKDIVDLGTTGELYSTESLPRSVEPLNKQIRTKLKAKLTEFGGCIYQQRGHMEKLRTAGVVFPQHEQLTPITDFQSNSALSQSDHASRPSSPPSDSSPSDGTPNRSVSPERDGPAVSDVKSPINMSVLEKLLHSKANGGKLAHPRHGGTNGSGIGFKDGSNIRSNAYGLHQLAHAQPGDVLASSIVVPPMHSILDPVNNTPFGFACTHKSSWTANSVEENSICGAFDAIKIRNAFLRVFVVLLTEYVESYTAAATSAGSSSVVPNGSSHGHGHGGLSRSSSSHTMDDGIASAIIPYMDGKESYLKGVKENIITINQRNSNSSITTSSSIAETAPAPKKRISFLKLGLSSKKTEPDVDKKVNPFRKTKETDSPITPPFDHDSFLKGQKDTFLRQLLETQMFCSFEEECGAGPQTFKRGKERSAEVTFFEESILAKKNRSALSYKTFTPFLSDTSNDITESFTAPEPTGWGLPLTPTLPGSSSSSSSSTEEITFSYQQFPALSPALFGPIRPARILLQKPEKGRQLSQSSNALQETMEMKARTLGRTDSSRSMGEGSRRAAAMRDRMAAARERNTRLLQSICKVQSLFRMLRPRRRYLVKLKAIRVIQRSYRLYAMRCARILAKKKSKNATFLGMVMKVQGFLRMSVRRKEYVRYRHAVIRLQSAFRRRVLRAVYLLKRRAVIKVEARVRAWMVQGQERRNRTQMARALRSDVLLLWEKEFTPLGYRSKFYLMIEGDSYLHLALYEEEKKRLIESLGGKYARSQLITGRSKKQNPSGTGSRNPTPPSAVGSQGDKSVMSANIIASGTPGKGDASPSRNPLMGSRKSSNLGANFDVNHDNMSLRLDGMERITVIGVPSRLLPHIEARLAISANMLKSERKEMYLRLKSPGAESVRESLFRMFEFDKKMKKKKATLSAYVWTKREEEHLSNSAQAILALSACTHSGIWTGSDSGSNSNLSSGTPGGPTQGGNSEWLNAKLRSRVQGACVESVRACMLSIQTQHTRELKERDSRQKDEAARNIISKSNSYKDNSKLKLWRPDIIPDK